MTNLQFINHAILLNAVEFFSAFIVLKYAQRNYKMVMVLLIRNIASTISSF